MIWYVCQTCETKQTGRDGWVLCCDNPLLEQKIVEPHEMEDE